MRIIGVGTGNCVSGVEAGKNAVKVRRKGQGTYGKK